jgi:flagellar motor switch protein FliG
MLPATAAPVDALIMAADTPHQPNVRDAAVLLLSLGEHAAANVLKHLGPKEVERVGAAMSVVGSLTVAQVSDTLSTFLNDVQIKAFARAKSDR